MTKKKFCGTDPLPLPSRTVRLFFFYSLQIDESFIAPSHEKVIGNKLLAFNLLAMNTAASTVYAAVNIEQICKSCFVYKHYDYASLYIIWSLISARFGVISR